MATDQPTPTPQTPDAFLAAVGSGDADAVDRALRGNPALASARDARGLSAVMLALYQRRDGVLDILLAADPPLDLCEAAALGRADLVEARLSEGAPHAGADGATALHLACFFGHADVARVLLERGADEEAVAPALGGVRPLHSAAASRRAGVVRILLEHGVEVNAKQQGGWTALHSAIKHKDAEMTRLLIAHGADEDQPADDGTRPRDFAAE